MKKQNKKGFTLVELLVVIAILAILATVSVVGYSQFTEKAKKSHDESEAHQLVLIVESYLLDGEEKVDVTVDSTNSTVVFSYTTTAVTAKVGTTDASEAQILAAVKKLCGDENSTLASKIASAKIENNKLAIEYQNVANSKTTLYIG